jgi:hypothetical protein
LLANLSDETLTVPKAPVPGIEVSESLVNKINSRSEPNCKVPTKLPRKEKTEALYHKFLRGKLDHIMQEDEQLIEPAHVFHYEETSELKGTNIEHQILVGDAQPIGRLQYRTPYTLMHEMQAQVRT